MPKHNLADLITEVKVTPLNAREGSKTVAFVTVTIAEHLVLKDMKIVEGQNGPFVSMPQRKGTDNTGADKWYDYYHAITKEGREDLQTAVLNAYKETAGGGSSVRSGGNSRSSGSERSSSRDAGRGDSRSTGREPSGAGARGGASRGSRDDDDDVPF